MQEIRTNYNDFKSFFEVNSREFSEYCQQVFQQYATSQNRVIVFRDARNTYLKLKLCLGCFLSIGYTSHKVIWINKSRVLKKSELKIFSQCIIDDLVKPSITVNAVLFNNGQVYYMFNPKP